MTAIETLIETTVHEVCDWQPGTVVVRQGSDADALIVVETGTLEVWLERGDRTDLIATVGRGEMIGEADLLAPGPAMVTVRAGAAASGLRLRSAELARLWDRAPARAHELHGLVLTALMGRLREANCQHETRGALRAWNVETSWARAAS